MIEEYTINGLDLLFFFGFFMCGWVAGEMKGRMFQAAGIYERKQKEREAKIEAKKQRKKKK